MSDFKHLISRRSGAVEHLTLNRPEVRNAFDDRLIVEITSWAGDIARDASVRVVVMSGAGESFCAGADLNWMRKMAGYSDEENLRDAEAAARMFAEIDRLPVPVIAPYVLAKIGMSAARELFLTGRRFGAEHAARIGLVHAVVPAERLDETVNGYVEDVLAAGPEAIAAAKLLLRRIAAISGEDAAALTAAAIAERRASAEARDRIRAFLKG